MGYWGTADELLSTLGVKETGFGVCSPSNPNTHGLEETLRVRRALGHPLLPLPPNRCCVQGWTLLTAREQWSGSEWILTLVDCGCELSCKREGFGIQLA